MRQDGGGGGASCSPASGGGGRPGTAPNLPAHTHPQLPPPGPPPASLAHPAATGPAKGLAMRRPCRLVPPHAAPHPGKVVSATADSHRLLLIVRKPCRHPPAPQLATAGGPGPAATLTAAPAGCGGGNVNKWGFIATSLECRVHLPLRSVPNRRGASSSSSCSSCRRRRYAIHQPQLRQAPPRSGTLTPTHGAQRPARAAPRPALPNAEPFPPLLPLPCPTTGYENGAAALAPLPAVAALITQNGVRRQAVGAAGSRTGSGAQPYGSSAAGPTGAVWGAGGSRTAALSVPPRCL